MSQEIIDRVITHLQTLPEELQLEALHLVQQLQSNPAFNAVSGKVLLAHIDSIDSDDIELMSNAIDEDCGRIDLDEW